MDPNADIIAVVEDLWRIPRPGPKNLLRAPRFTGLSELCAAKYGIDKPVFALSTALRSLGLPCQLPAGKAHLALDPVVAANALDEACRRKTSVRRHLCPLDLAADLPVVTFGRSRIAQFSADELAALFDAPRIERTMPNKPLDAQRLAQFQWLVVDEEIALDHQPEKRASPWMFMAMNRDFGEIDPHLGRFPPAVEAALFCLILAPWEDWSTMQEVEWRGFRLPWVHTVDEDLFIRPAAPPIAESLTLEPWIVDDDGEELELERPTELPLSDEAKRELGSITDQAWHDLESARATPIFETPITHFLVRAFLSDGIDEVMAHMTAIEAAVGLEIDHKAFMRPKPDPHKGMKPTNRVAARIGALLNDKLSVQAYKDLFELRSQFVHGRGGLQKISTPQRVLARSLARRVVAGIVDLALQDSRPRIDVLSDLLDDGAALLSADI
jgi:hypothetical protein